MIYLIDYDAGNLLSIKRALNFLNFKFLTVQKINNISSNDLLLIPGVGSFAHASTRIKKSGLFEIANQNPRNRPFIVGICLGMQLLMRRGFEGGESEGLNLIDGSVESIFSKKPKNLDIPKTIIGWQNYELTENISHNYNWLNSYKGNSFYHVHSYMCIPKNPNNIYATYPDKLSFIPNIIGDSKKKVLGFQFHPEKSGQKGLNFLKEVLNSFFSITN